MPEEKNNMTLGAFLRSARKEKGISVSQLSADTRILKSHIHALEENKLNELPPKIFVIGFLKSIGDRLDVEEQALIERYTQERLECEETIQHTRSKQMGPSKILWTALGIGSMLLFLAMFWYFWGQT